MTATMKEQHLNQENQGWEKNQMIDPIVEFPIAKEFSEHTLVLLKFNPELNPVLFTLRSRFLVEI